MHMENFDHMEILLAEDSEADGEMTLRALRRHNIANQVVWVRDGAEALDYVFGRGQYETRTRRPKLILLDLKMPKVDGLEVLKQLKEDDSTRTIPIVIMASSAEERDLIEGYRLGVNSYVVKPIGFDQFMETVADLGYFWALVNQTPPHA